AARRHLLRTRALVGLRDRRAHGRLGVRKQVLPDRRPPGGRAAHRLRAAAGARGRRDRDAGGDALDGRDRPGAGEVLVRVHAADRVSHLPHGLARGAHAAAVRHAGGGLRDHLRRLHGVHGPEVRLLPALGVRRNRRPLGHRERPVPRRLPPATDVGVHPRAAVDAREDRGALVPHHLAPRHVPPSARGPAAAGLVALADPAGAAADRGGRRLQGRVLGGGMAVDEPGVRKAPEEEPKSTGLGLMKGLGVTLKHALRPSITQQYPEVKPDLPPRTRGVIALKEANCTVCYKCSRECPDWCIYIDAHKETHEPASGGRGRSMKVLDRFAIDYALCMYCGICVEVCPFDALFWSPEFEYAEYDIVELTHEKEKLEEWTYTVLPPPFIEEGAEVPAEITTEAPDTA